MIIFHYLYKNRYNKMMKILKKKMYFYKKYD